MDQGQPDALLQRLHEYLAQEDKFKPNLQLPCAHCGEDVAAGDVTIGIRDGTAQVLRCLKIWYDMPSEVLFVSLNLVDRFLTKMKARAKHMACIAVASFQLSCTLVCAGKPGCPPVPEAAEVAAISQCKCTPGDLTRMQSIITSKLGGSDGAAPITAIDFMRVFHQLFLSVDQCNIYNRMVEWSEMCQKLEITTCDASISNFRPSEVALVLIVNMVDAGTSRVTEQPPTDDVMRIADFANELKKICKMSDVSFYECHRHVLSIINRYNSQQQIPHRQRLTWRLSHRTLRKLRPTDKLKDSMILPTILEGRLPPLPPPRQEDDWSGDEWPVPKTT